MAKWPEQMLLDDMAQKRFGKQYCELDDSERDNIETWYLETLYRYDANAPRRRRERDREFFENLQD